MAININKKITLNGKEVGSIEELGKEFAEAFGDKNKDGVPDGFEDVVAMAKDAAKHPEKYKSSKNVNKTIQVNTTATGTMGSESKPDMDSSIPENPEISFKAPQVNIPDPNAAEKSERNALILNNILKWGFLISALYILFKIVLRNIFN